MNSRKFDQIKKIQSTVGAEPDGFFGPLSRAALTRYLGAMVPYDCDFPKPTTHGMDEYYGDFGKWLALDNPHKKEFRADWMNENLVYLNVRGLGMTYNNKPVTRVRIHKKLAPSLLGILRQLSEKFPDVLENYGGVFNIRSMRGGDRWSMHSWAAAIDLSPSRNGFRTLWPQVADMPLGVMEIFAAHGWLSLGGVYGFDAMHFQATAWPDVTG